MSAGGRSVASAALLAAVAVLAGGASSALAAAAEDSIRIPQCEPGDPDARRDPRCEAGDRPPPGVAVGAPAQDPDEPAAPARGRFRAPSPGPLPGGGLIRLGAPAEPAAVRAVQRRLTRSGFPVRRDGVYGPRTAATVRRFQDVHRLLVDGIVGRQTQAALRHFARVREHAAPRPAAPPRAGLGGAAQKRTRVLSPLRRRRDRVTFDVRRIDADTVVSATLRAGRRRWRIATTQFRSAARTRRVAVRIVRRGARRVAVASAAGARTSAGGRVVTTPRRTKLVLVTSAGAAASQQGTTSPTGEGATSAGGSGATRDVDFGAWTAGDPYDGRIEGTERLQSDTGRRVQTVLWYQNWGSNDWIKAVQPQLLDVVAGSGREPLVTWEPWNPEAAAKDQPEFALRRIADGAFDDYVGSWADRLRDTGKTVYLRPMHEMNGDWYPWSGTVNGNSPADYVRAWRRMHDIFAQRGATNVRWVWAPNNYDVPQTTGNAMERYYPGDDYVDVLGIDGYNWGTGVPFSVGWQSFAEVFDTAYRRLRELGPQPIWITEVGSAPQGGDKQAWIQDMFERAGRMDRLESIVWFNENKERDWRANPTAEVAAAFRP